MTKTRLWIAGLMVAAASAAALGTAGAQTASLEGVEAAGSITGTPVQIDVITAEEGTTRTTYMQSGDLAITEGDIVLGPYSEISAASAAAAKTTSKTTTSGARAGTTSSLVAIKDLSRLWPKASTGLVNVPYAFTSTLSSSARTAIQAAITDFNTQSCIRFIPRTTQADHVSFINGNGCYAQVGRQGGQQQVSIGAGCESKGTALHEMLHALGFWHEHSRPDRDTYLTVNLANVQTGMESQLTKLTTTQAQNMTTYDFASVMHYGPKSFSKNGLSTMTPKVSGVTIGNRSAMSAQDIAGLKQRYSCP